MGIRVRCLTLSGTDPTNSTGRMTMNAIDAVAQFERDLPIKRTQAELSHAKAQGKPV